MLYFAPGLFSAQVPVFRDLLVLVIPLRSHALAAVRGGELPLWNPDLFLGAPFLANYQSAVLYPPSVLLYLLPFPQALSIFLAFHLLLAGSGMTLYLRAAHGLQAPAALLGGIVFSGTGFFVSLVPLTNQLEVAAWAPWVLLAGRRYAATGEPRWFAALTLFFAMQALGGAPESAALTGLLLALDSRRPWRRIGHFGIALVLALGVCAAQLLPTLEYFLQTDRAAGLPYSSVTSESLRWRSLFQLILPHRFADGAPGFVPEGGIPLFWSLYVGIVPLSLAIVALAEARAASWWIALAGGVVLALGSSTPLFGMLYDLAPRLVGLFRYPGKFFLLAHSALAVLAAHGLARAVVRRTARKAAAAACAGVLGATVVLALWGSAAPRPFLGALGYDAAGLAASTVEALAAPPRSTAARSAAVALVVLLLLWLFARRTIGSRTLAASLIAVTLADVLPVHLPTLVFVDWSRLRESVDLRRLGLRSGERLFHYCAEAGCVPAGAPGFGAWNGRMRPLERVEVRARELWSALVPDVPIVYGLGAVAGVDGWSTRDRDAFYRTLALLPRRQGLRLLEGLGVNRLIGQSPLPDLDPETAPDEEGDRGDRTWRYALPEPAPRLYLAERILFAPDTASALERVARPDFRPGRDAVVAGPAGAPSREAGAGAIEEETIGRATIDARIVLSSPGFLVVSDSFYPGWRATVDGSAADVVRTNGIVRGVHVPAGRHTVALRYRPRSFRVGCGISLATLTVLAAGLVAARRHGRVRTGD
ncbi:MAG: YfhO family protein [Deltaproteobacteria bacterium]|nr:YfhO family protein [Deltaproteobacteria bacterium]